MPKGKKQAEPEAPKTEEKPLVSAAKKIGKAAGKIAAAAGAEPPDAAPPAPVPPRAASTPKAPSGKLQKKNKQRLPRRLKKARKKAQGTQT